MVTLPFQYPYSLIPCSRFLLEKLTGFRLVKTLNAFYGTRMFITPFTSVRHMSLSWARLMQFMPPLPTSRRSILILSSHPQLGLPSGLFPTDFPTETCMHLYSPPYVLHVSPISNTLQLLMTNKTRELYKFLCLSATSFFLYVLISLSLQPNFIRISSKCLPSVHKLHKHIVCFNLCSL